MAKLFNFKAAYPTIETLYGIDTNASDFEDLALSGWERIGNKHTRLYKYVADTENKELVLPCNVDIIESVHIPVVDAQYTSNKTDYIDLENFTTEQYIEGWKVASDPYNSSGKLVKYREGDNTLYFPRDYKDVKVIYHGVLVDDEDGLPLINEREMNAIASFVAWRNLYKDGLIKKDVNLLNLANVVKAEWLTNCSAARVKDHLSQNDMDAILDAKTRWDRKKFGQSLMPLV